MLFCNLGIISPSHSAKSRHQLPLWDFGGVADQATTWFYGLVNTWVGEPGRFDLLVYPIIVGCYKNFCYDCGFASVCKVGQRKVCID
jgi:hypothetical protein